MLDMLVAGLTEAVITKAFSAFHFAVSAPFNLLKMTIGGVVAAFKFVAGHALSFGMQLLKLIPMLAGGLIVGLGAFVGAIAAATKAAMDYASGVVALRNATGMSTGQAQGVTGRFGAFGFKAGDLSNGGQFHGITSLSGRAFGVNAYDPESINTRS